MEDKTNKRSSKIDGEEMKQVDVDANMTAKTQNKEFSCTLSSFYSSLMIKVKFRLDYVRLT